MENYDYDYNYDYELYNVYDDEEAENYPPKSKDFRRRSIEEMAPNRLNDFQEQFRLSPRMFELLLQRLGPRLAPKVSTNHSLTPERKLLIALKFYATNAFYYELRSLIGINILKAFIKLNELRSGKRDHISYYSRGDSCTC
jgi:hypothetical protein